MEKTTRNTLLWVFIFSISMGFFESSVVVYLRALYYPEGFSFPLNPISSHVALTEFIREAASLIMIVSVAGLAFKSILRRFAGFLFIFAIWDIFYYVFLKLLLGWPQSLFTWDILFLIPVTWAGPVVSPLIISILMLVLAFIILYYSDKQFVQFFIHPREWVYLIAGAFVVFLSFIWDYTRFLFQHLQVEGIRSFYDEMEILSTQYIPQQFNWILFVAGCIIIAFTIFLIYNRNRKISRE